MIQHYTPNTSGKWNTKEYIVIHHTATGIDTVQWVINGFMWKRIASAHYLIDEKWVVHKFNTDSDKLWHAGVSSREWKEYLNNYSIGIELIWPLPWFTWSQKKALRNLISDLMSKYNIPYNKIIRHKDIAPHRKVDVDDSLRWYDYSSREEYQKSFLNTNKKYPMTENQKEMLIKNQMNLNSTLYNLVDDEELKRLMSEMNKLYRKKWFDNK